MNRRNTILIAVLVNAGLLLVLFATAIRSNKDVKPNEPVLADIRSSAPALQNEIPQDPVNPYLTLPTLADSSQEELIFSPEMTKTFPAEEISSAPSMIATAPVPTPVTPSSSSSVETKQETIVVKKGDMLEKLAKAHGTTVAAIVKANQLSSTQLKIGQILKVPGKIESSVIAKVEKKEEVPNYYVIKEGDSPWLIASKNQVKLEELLKLNNLDEQKAKKLRPGDRLRIR